MKTTTKLLSLTIFVILAALVFAPTAYAFDGRDGDKILISSQEVINDDLYLAGTEVIVEGTINGDLMAAGEIVIINGVVTGDLFVAGNSVTVNGEVGDDLFAAAASVTLGPSAKVADDVFSAGASVDMRSGSQVGGSVLLGAARGLVASAIAEDLKAGSNSLRLEGTVDGNAAIYVDASENSYIPNFTYGGGSSIPMVSIPGGLTFGPEAKVAGLLEYTSPDTVSIGSEIANEVQHYLPPVDEELAREFTSKNTTSNYIFDQIRNLVALLLVGMLIAWLAPRWIERPAEVIRTRLLPSLGIGLVGVVAAPVVFLIILGVIILVAVLFGLLSLPSLTGLTLITGFPLLGILFAALVVIGSYLCQSIIAYLTGQWILNKVRPEWNSKIYLPLLLGLVIYSLLFAIPILGGFLQFTVILIGFGAILHLLISTRTAPMPVTPVVADTI